VPVAIGGAAAGAAGATEALLLPQASQALLIASSSGYVSGGGVPGGVRGASLARALSLQSLPDAQARALVPLPSASLPLLTAGAGVNTGAAGPGAAAAAGARSPPRGHPLALPLAAPALVVRPSDGSLPAERHVRLPPAATAAERQVDARRRLATLSSARVLGGSALPLVNAGIQLALLASASAEAPAP
jgi:hypothetical protein